MSVSCVITTIRLPCCVGDAAQVRRRALFAALGGARRRWCARTESTESAQLLDLELRVNNGCSSGMSLIGNCVRRQHARDLRRPLSPTPASPQ